MRYHASCQVRVDEPQEWARTVAASSADLSRGMRFGATARLLNRRFGNDPNVGYAETASNSRCRMYRERLSSGSARISFMV